MEGPARVIFVEGFGFTAIHKDGCWLGRETLASSRSSRHGGGGREWKGKRVSEKRKRDRCARNGHEEGLTFSGCINQQGRQLLA
jgi:hypothetical protein